MAWNYAELSKAAKVAGGPEELVESLIEFGRKSGRKEVLPLIGVAAAISVLGVIGVQKVIVFFKRKKLNQAEVETIKAELIQGIKEYDASHQDEKKTDDNKERQE